MSDQKLVNVFNVLLHSASLSLKNSKPHHSIKSLSTRFSQLSFEMTFPFIRSLLLLVLLFHSSLFFLAIINKHQNTTATLQIVSVKSWNKEVHSVAKSFFRTNGYGCFSALLETVNACFMLTKSNVQCLHNITRRVFVKKLSSSCFFYQEEKLVLS